MTDPYQIRWERTQWFRESRFGLFIHWGLYAIPGRGEWVRSTEKMKVEDYEKFFREFDPDLYDPKTWARLAREAGMKYAVMTAKHHDGFCLFDSKLTEYKATNTPAGRDLIREYIEAFRAEGLRVGLYYSLLDWYHPDYPHYGDRIHPMRDNPEFKEKTHRLENYVDYMHGQVRELLTNYGKIDILWFDFSYDEMSGAAWKAEELTAMVRELQPEVLVDSRLGADPRNSDAPSYAGDFATPEQMIPASPMADDRGRPVPWEACITHNGHWGYSSRDNRFLSPRQVVRTLVSCVSKGGNLLLNAGPSARGEIPDSQQGIMRAVGEWLRQNGESVYGAGVSEFPKPEWGRLTQKGNRLFAHVQDRGMGTVVLPGMRNRLRNPRVLATGEEVGTESFFTMNHPDDFFLFLPREESEFDPVIELEVVDSERQ